MSIEIADGFPFLIIGNSVENKYFLRLLLL